MFPYDRGDQALALRAAILDECQHLEGARGKGTCENQDGRL